MSKSSISDVGTLLGYKKVVWIELQTTLFLILPVLLRLADVGLVAELGHLLGLGEEFLGLVGIGLLDGEVADLAEQEVVEVCPVGLLGVE